MNETQFQFSRSNEMYIPVQYTLLYNETQQKKTKFHFLSDWHSGGNLQAVGSGHTPW